MQLVWDIWEPSTVKQGDFLWKMDGQWMNEYEVKIDLTGHMDRSMEIEQMKVV